MATAQSRRRAPRGGGREAARCLAGRLTRLLLAGAALTGGPACAEEPWLQSAADPPEWLRLSGSFRARYETLGGQFRPGLDGGDQLISLRTILAAEADFERWRLGAELFDSRAYLGDAGGSVGTSEVNALELVQAYAALSFADALAAGAEAKLTLGRFTVDLGSRRLAARDTFRNTTGAYTGARVDWGHADGVQLALIYALPRIRLPADKDSILDNEIAFDEETTDFRFWAAFLAAPLPARTGVEAFVFGLEEEDSAARPTRNRDLVTPGFRLVRESQAGDWDFEIEAGAQRGHARASSSPADITDLDVEASYAHLEAGYRWVGAWAPRLALEYDYASGEASSADGELNRFDSLFGTRSSDFGPTGIYGPLGFANIVSAALRVEARARAGVSLQASYRALWLDEPVDVFASTGVRDPVGASGDFAGHQIEGRVGVPLSGNVRLDVGAAALIEGEFLKHAPNRTGEGDTLYGFADLTVSF